MSSPADRRSIRRPTRRVIGRVLVVAAVILTSTWFMVEGPGARWISPPGSSVAAFSGSDDQATAGFTVRTGWRIAWSSGGPFAMRVLGDQNLGTVVNVDQATSGVTSPPIRGTFRLEITADGPWTVTILQGD